MFVSPLQGSIFRLPLDLGLRPPFGRLTPGYYPSPLRGSLTIQLDLFLFRLNSEIRVIHVE